MQVGLRHDLVHFLVLMRNVMSRLLVCGACLSNTLADITVIIIICQQVARD
jgi:hypothetical protein